MKLLRFFPAILVVVAHAAPFRTTSRVDGWKRHYEISEQEKAPLNPIVTITAPLDIPRGGGVLGTPIAKENLVAMWIVFWSATGALLPAPQKITQLYRQTPKPVEPLQYFCLENCAAMALGIVIMSYMSVFQNAECTKTAVMGTLPLGYVTYKAVLNDTFAKLAWRKGVGLAELILFAILYVSYFGGIGPDPVLLVKMLLVPATMIGLLGWIEPNRAANIYGFSDRGPATTQAAFYWMHRMYVVFSFMAGYLVNGTDAIVSIGWAAFFYTLSLVDSTFIARDSPGVGTPQATMIGLIFMSAVVCLGLWIK